MILERKIVSLKETQQNTSKSSPKLIIVTSFALITLGIGNILYTKHLTNQLSLTKNKKNELKDHIINFFDENPRAKKTYNKWNTK